MSDLFPSHDEDGDHLQSLSSIEPRPIFIMGAHRSGTTFIYDALAQCLPVGRLDLYTLFFYERLLSNRIRGREDEDRRSFNRYVSELGIEDRGLDHMPVSDRTVEEYFFLINKKKWMCWPTVNPLTRGRFEQICKKISLAQDRSHVLLKNPFDYTNAKLLLRYFPSAKFVFIKRDPAETLNSQLAGIDAIQDWENHPYFDLMASIHPWTLAVLQWYYRERIRRYGAEKIKELSIRPAIKRLGNEQRKVVEAVPQLPDGSYIVVDYGQFTSAPIENIHRVCDFLRVDLAAPAQDIEPRPRGKRLHPVVQRNLDQISAIPALAG